MAIKTRIDEIRRPQYNHIGTQTVNIDPLTRDWAELYKQKSGAESYFFEIQSLHPVYRDSRPTFLKIIHHSTTLPIHEITLVIDLKEPYKGYYHLNLTDESKRVLHSCLPCKKYFEALNHFPLIAEMKVHGIITVDSIWHLVKDKLTFFKDYELVGRQTTLFD